MYICRRASNYIQAYAHVYMYMHIHIHTYIHIYQQFIHTYAPGIEIHKEQRPANELMCEHRVHMYIYIYIYTYICIYMHIHINIRPTQSVIYVQFLVARFQEISLLIVLYQSQKSCAEYQILQNPILHTRLCGACFITHHG